MWPSGLQALSHQLLPTTPPLLAFLPYSRAPGPPSSPVSSCHGASSAVPPASHCGLKGPRILEF